MAAHQFRGPSGIVVVGDLLASVYDQSPLFERYDPTEDDEAEDETDSETAPSTYVGPVTEPSDYDTEEK